MHNKRGHDRTRFLVLALFLVLVWYFSRNINLDRIAIEKYLSRFPLAYSGIIFIIAYVGVTFFLWLSKDPLKIIAAFLFGAWFSTLFIWLAETINAIILFALSRKLGREFVEKSLRGRLSNLDRKIGGLNFFWLFLFRVTPLFPFRFLDLAAGLTGISLKRYLTAVILGSPLRIFWVQYILVALGRGVFHPSVLMRYMSSQPAFFVLSLIYLVLVVVVALKMKVNK